MAYATPILTDNNTISEILLDLIRVAIGATNTALSGISTAVKQDISNTYLLNINAKIYASKGFEIWGSAENITDTTLTTILPAQGAGNFTYASSILVTNSHATQGTIVRIIDGNDDTTVLYSGYAAPAGGGFSVSLPTPIRSGLDNKAIKAKCVTTGASELSA